MREDTVDQKTLESKGKSKMQREREKKKCRKSRKKCREKNAEATVSENHDREIELVRVRRRIKRNGGVI